MDSPDLSGEPELLVGAGDIADCYLKGHARTARLLDELEGTVFTLGDNVYERGTPEEFEACYEPTWGRHKSRTRPAAGNHEYLTPGARGYYEYFGEAAGDPSKGYYSYDLGGWHIVVLNTAIDISRTSAQLEWLEEDLASSGAVCALAYGHHPRFSSSPDAPSDTSLVAAWEVLYDAGVEVFMAGHAHIYERFTPQTASGEADPDRGVRQFVVGTGGRHLFPPAPAPEANSDVAIYESLGLLRLSLYDEGYEWEFLAVGVPFPLDRGAALCH